MVNGQWSMVEGQGTTLSDTKGAFSGHGLLAVSRFVIAVSDGDARDGAAPAPSSRALP